MYSSTQRTIKISPLLLSTVGLWLSSENMPEIDAADIHAQGFNVSIETILKNFCDIVALAHDCRTSMSYAFGEDLTKYLDVETEFQRGTSYKITKNLAIGDFTFEDWRQRLNELTHNDTSTDFIANILCQNEIGMQFAIFGIAETLLSVYMPTATILPQSEYTLTPLVEDNDNIIFKISKVYNADIPDKDEKVLSLQDAVTISFQFNFITKWKLFFLSNVEIKLAYENIADLFDAGLGLGKSINMYVRDSMSHSNLKTLFPEFGESYITQFWEHADSFINSNEAWGKDIDKDKAIYWLFLHLIYSDIDISSFYKLVKSFTTKKNYDAKYWPAVVDICVKRLQILVSSSSVEIKTELSDLLDTMKNVITKSQEDDFRSVPKQRTLDFSRFSPAEDRYGIYFMLHAKMVSEYGVYDKSIDGKYNYICCPSNVTAPNSLSVILERFDSKNALTLAEQFYKESKTPYRTGYGLYLQSIDEAASLPVLNHNQRKFLPVLVKQGNCLYIYASPDTKTIVQTLLSTNFESTNYKKLTFPDKTAKRFTKVDGKDISDDIYRSIAGYHKYIGDLFDDQDVFRLLKKPECTLKILFPICLSYWHAGEVLLSKITTPEKIEVTINVYAHSPFGTGIIDPTSYDAIVYALESGIARLFPNEKKVAVTKTVRAESTFVMPVLNDLDYLGSGPAVYRMLYARINAPGNEMQCLNHGAIEVVQQFVGSIKAKVFKDIEFSEAYETLRKNLSLTVQYLSSISIVSRSNLIAPSARKNSLDIVVASPSLASTDAAQRGLPILLGKIDKTEVKFQEQKFIGTEPGCDFLALGLEPGRNIIKQIASLLTNPKIVKALFADIMQILRENQVATIEKIFNKSEQRSKILQLFRDYIDREQTFVCMRNSVQYLLVSVDNYLSKPLTLLSHDEFIEYVNDHGEMCEAYDFLNGYYQNEVQRSYKLVSEFCQQQNVCSALLNMYHDDKFVKVTNGLLNSMVIADILPGICVWQKYVDTNDLIILHKFSEKNVSIENTKHILRTHSGRLYTLNLLSTSESVEIAQPDEIPSKCCDIVPDTLVVVQDIFVQLNSISTLKIINFLSTPGIDLRTVDQGTGNNLLHLFVKWNNAKLVNYIVQLVPNLSNQQNKDGFTPIALAQSLGERDIIIDILRPKSHFAYDIKLSSRQCFKQEIYDLFSKSSEKITHEELSYRLRTLFLRRNESDINLADTDLNEKKLGIILHSLRPLPIYSLSLQNCNLNDDAIPHLAKFLASNQTLVSLILYRNNISDKGLCLLGEVLSTNRVLRVLNLGYNKVTDLGIKILLEYLSTSGITDLNVYCKSEITLEKSYLSVSTFLQSHVRLTSLYMHFLGSCVASMTKLNTILQSHRKLSLDFFAAIKKHEFAEMVRLYSMGINTHFVDQHGNNAIHIAIQNDAGTDVVLWLLLMNVACCFPNNIGETPQSLAEKKGLRSIQSLVIDHLKNAIANRNFVEILKLDYLSDKQLIAKLLLLQGFDIEATDTDKGWTALHYAVDWNDADLFNLLVDSGARMTESTHDQLSPLHHAILKYNHSVPNAKRMAMIKKMLDSPYCAVLCSYQEEALSTLNSLFKSAIELAVIKGDIETIQLMHGKIELNRLGIHGLPLTHLAVRHNQFSVLQLLLDYEEYASLDAANNNLLDVVLHSPNADKFLEIIVNTVPGGIINQWIVQKIHADSTPIHLASHIDKELLKLEESGIQNKDGDNLFHTSIMEDSRIFFDQLLLSKGQQFVDKSWLEGRNTDGNTPLILAAHHERSYILERLLNNITSGMEDVLFIQNRQQKNILNVILDQDFIKGLELLLKCVSRLEIADSSIRDKKIILRLLSADNAAENNSLSVISDVRRLDALKMMLQYVDNIGFFSELHDSRKYDLLYYMICRQNWIGITILLEHFAGWLGACKDDAVKYNQLRESLIALKNKENVLGLTTATTAKMLIVKIKEAATADSNVDMGTLEGVFSLLVKLPGNLFNGKHLLNDIIAADFSKGAEWFIKCQPGEARNFFVEKHDAMELMMADKSVALCDVVSRFRAQIQPQRGPGFFSFISTIFPAAVFNSYGSKPT